MTRSIRQRAVPVFRAALALLVAAAIGACTVEASPSPVGSAATSTPLPASGATASGSTGTGGSLAIDPTLLAVLPSAVDGVPLQESADGESDARGNAQLPSIASAVAAALAIDSATSDFVYALVVRLVPAAFDDAHFRDWRDSYDEGACSGAGGVIGHAQADFDGRTVFIGTCSAGVRTYHVWIPDKNLLISASAAGDRALGERLMDELAP